MTRRRDGGYWEQRACEYLERRGVEVLEHGYRCRFGELDLICRDGATLAIVEVRSRGSGSVVSALETVDAAKRRKLIRATGFLLMQRPEWAERPLRFDVVAIDTSATASRRYVWIKNAFEVRGDA